MDRDQAKLFVGGISRDTSEDTLKDHFDKYGAVMGSVVAKDKSTKNPRGFGFVWFSDPSAADKALTDTHVIGGRTVEVKKAIPRNDQPKNQQLNNGLSMINNNDNSSNQIRTRKIFVGGLPTDLTEEEFKNYFEFFGRVTDVVVMHDSVTHRPRGFGFITYDSEESVENVMKNSFHELNGRLVEVKRAVPKEENNWNGNGYVRNGGGRGSSGNVYLPGNYLPYGPTYAPNYASAPYFVYSGFGGFYNGTGVYNGWYPGFGYGVAPIANGYGPRGNGARACLLPYGNTSIHPSCMNGDVSAIDLAASGNNDAAWPGINVEVNQVVLGNGRSQHSVEGEKLDADPLSLNGSSEAASSKQG